MVMQCCTLNMQIGVWMIPESVLSVSEHIVKAPASGDVIAC